MRLPLFNFFELPKHPQLFSALRAAGPTRAWALMNELAAYDRPLYEQDLEGTETLDEMGGRARVFMDSAPFLNDRDKDWMASEFCQYGPRLQFETTFLLLWMNDADVLFGEVVEVEGRQHLEEALAGGHGVLALPLHLGPSYVISPLIAHQAPVTAVFNRMNFDELREIACPDLPLEAFQLSETSTFRAGVTAMRSGRVFAMFPELDPRGVDDHHLRVPLLGTTVMAPLGPVLMSRVAQAPMITVVLESLGDARFRLRYGKPIAAPGRRDDPSVAMGHLWQVIDDELRAGPLDQWEMWLEFDQMAPMGQA